ncbi:DUF6112 family protein [Promicromonospora soli]
MTRHPSTTVAPDFDAVMGAGLDRIVGALLTVGLVTAVAMAVVCAAGWAVASSSGNWQATAKARAGVLVALGGAACCGGALAWTNWLVDLGTSL